jgi:signal peptidase I
MKSRDKSFMIPFKGKSMEPLLREGDLIKISLVEFPTLKNGDVVLFKDSINSELILHRMISQNKAKGDSANDFENFEEKYYLGKAISFERNHKEYQFRFGRTFSFFSKMRFQNLFIKIISIVGLNFLSQLTLICNEKTT